MREFTFSEARQALASVLELALREGAVRIRRRNGQVFVLRPELSDASPLDVDGLNLDLTRDDVVALVHEGRRPV